MRGLSLILLVIAVTIAGTATGQETGSPRPPPAAASTFPHATASSGPVIPTLPNPIRFETTSAGSAERSVSLAPWITAIAAATGAAFAIWKWGFEERIRQSREMATLDGDVSIEIIDTESTIVGAFIESVWDNKGTLPVFLDRDKCRIRIYELSTAAAPEVIDPSDKEVHPRHRKVADFCPIRTSGMFMLEPGTSSRIQSSVLLPKGPIYEVRSYIQTIRVGTRPSTLWWFRRRMFNSAERRKS